MRVPSDARQNRTSWRNAGLLTADTAGTALAGAFGLCTTLTSPTNRMPLRDAVRIRRCSLPLSPSALRSELMRLVSVDSDTIRPPQIDATRSSLVTTRSRFSTR